MAQEKIIISFKAIGDKSLLKAINSLNKATKELEGKMVQSASAGDKLSNSQRLVNHRMSSNIKTASLLSGAFATLRNKLLLASFAATMAAKPLFELVKAQSDAEEIANKFNVVFGKQADIVRNWAKALGASVGRASSELEFMLATLQDTFVPLGFTREAATKLSTSLTQLALDVASFNNKADADVIRDFQSALVGNHETVRKYGIIINEVTLKEEALRSGISQTNRELTEGEKVQARLNLIFAGSKDAIGDLHNTQHSFNNELKRFNAEVLIARQGLGERLMPAARDLLVVMSGLVKHFTDIAVIKGYATAIGAVSIALIGARIHTLGWAASLTALKIAMVKTGIGALAVGVGELGARMVYGKQQTDELGDSFDDIDEKLKNLLSGEGGIDKLTSAELELAEVTKALNKIRKEEAKMLDDIEKAEKALNAEIAKQDQKARTEEIRKLNEEKKKLEQQIKDEIKLQADLDRIDKELLATLKAIDAADKQLILANQEKNALFDNQITIKEQLMANDEKWMQAQEKLTTAQNEIDVAGQAAAQKELNAIKKERISLQLQEFDQEGQRLILSENRKVLDGELTTLEAEQNIINAQRNDLTAKYFDILHSRDPDTELAFKQAQLELDQQQLDLNEKFFQREQAIMAARIQMWSKGIAAISNIVGANSRNAKLAANIQALAAVVDAFAAAQSSFAAAATHPFTVANPSYPGIVYATTLASGLAQAAAAKAAADKMEQGGLIGGRRHSQGGTLIEAEQGEFIMSRNAVESIGIENLNRMNQTGGGGAVTVNVSGNVMSQDFVEGELAEQIKEAVRRGGREQFGLS
tara:strand:- start:3945 stop:6398 length:2454 start_codon:yes stop_codon:yes gene_type:complete